MPRESAQRGKRKGVGTRRATTRPGFTSQAIPDQVGGTVKFVEIGAGVRAPTKFLVTIREPGRECVIRARVSRYGRPECFGLNVTLTDKAKLDWRTLNALPLTEWLATGMTLVLQIREGDGPEWSPSMFTPSEARDKMLRRLRRSVVDRSGSRRPIDLEHLEQVARIYKAGGNKPILALKAAFPNHERTTINKWVARARSEGLIPPAKYTRKEGTDG